MKTLLQFLAISIISLLFFGFITNSKPVAKQIKHLSNNSYETHTPIAISGDFRRVSIDQKKQIITYEYTGKQITFEINKGDVLVKIKQSNREVLQLKSNKNNARIITGKSGEWMPLQSSIKKIDTEHLALLLGNPTYYGKAYIGNILKSREATDIETRIIDLLSTATEQTAQSGGTTTGNCSCSGQSISVSCPNGCGITCRNEEREVCDTVQTETGDLTNTSDCWKETFCIGGCAC